MLKLAVLLCASYLSAAPLLTIDNPTQILWPGGSVAFTGTVVFDEFMPLGAEPTLSPSVPAEFFFDVVLGLAEPFFPGDTYSGVLFLIRAPEDAVSQTYTALAAVGGSNPVEINVFVNPVPEPGAFGLVAFVALVGYQILRRDKATKKP